MKTAKNRKEPRQGQVNDVHLVNRENPFVY